MSLGSFILVQVGRAILRVRPEKLAATLRRFKGAKEIKKPKNDNYKSICFKYFLWKFKISKRIKEEKKKNINQW